MVKFTERAKEQVKMFLQDKDPAAWGLRIRIKGGTNFNFFLQDLKALTPEDAVSQVESFKVVFEKESENELEEATIDWLEKPFNTGFKVELKKALPPSLPGLDFKDPRVQKIHELLQEEINPALASHGGFAALKGFKDNVVYLELGGGCQGCGMVDVTLKSGIEMRLKEEIPEIARIVDQTDHAGGDNPCYQPSK